MTTIAQGSLYANAGWRVVGVVVVMTTTAAVASCSSGDDVSNTPRVTVDESRSDESAWLLSAHDVTAIPAFAGAVASDLGDLPVFENPDPRGPCGGPVPDAPLENAAGRAFSGDSFVIFELVTAGDEARAYVRALIEDSRGVPRSPFESQTNTGAIQQVSDVNVIDLQGLGDSAIGWTSTIEVGGQTIHGGAIAIESEERFAFVQLQGADPPPIDAVSDLAARAADRLAG